MAIEIVVGLPGLSNGPLLDRARAMQVPVLVSANAFSRWKTWNGCRDWHGWRTGSHGRLRSYFSLTDDADDVHATKIAIVIGQLDDPAGPDMATRLCAAGMFLTLPRSPFAGEHDAA